MEISSTDNQITIAGNIKTVSDYQEIKTRIDSVISQHKTITVNIKDSISITSSVIGYFTKIVMKDKIGLTMMVGNSQLLDLLDDLSLKSVFKAKQA